MAAAGSFTLEDDEDPQVIAPPPSSVVSVVNKACPAPPVPASAPAPTSPTPPCPLQHAPSSGLGLHLRDPPKAHVDADLGVNTLTQAVSVLQENQKEIELTETHLQDLLRLQTRLVAASKLLEQQKALDVLATGPELGYDAGRPIASLLVYRCCLRWGSFGADAPPSASAVLDHITALLLQATDEDSINARHAAAARGGGGEGGGSSGGSGGAVQAPGGGCTEDQGQILSEQAAVAATREVAYWLAVTSTLLALVDPHLPLQVAPSQQPASARGGSVPAHHNATTPLAAVAGDARASMARAASAAAAKVQEFKKRMGVLGNNLLRLRGSIGQGTQGTAAAAATLGGGGGAGGGSTRGSGGGGKEGEAGQQHQQGGGAAEEGQSAAAEGQHTEELPPLPQAPSAPPPQPSAPAVPPSAGATEPQQPLRQPSPAPASTHLGTSPGHSHSHSQCFRQQLDVLLHKSYNQMRDTLKRHVSSVLPGCVQQPVLSPRTPRSPSPHGAGSAGGANADGGLETRGRSLRSGGGAADGGVEVAAMQGGAGGGSVGGAPTVTAAVSLQPWLDLIAVLSQHLELLRAAHVPRIIIRCLFKQTFVFIDVQLFNQLLLRPECCSTSNAHYLVAGLQLLDKWIVAPGQQAQDRVSGPGSAGGAPAAASEDLLLLAEDLRHIRQAAHFLALANKGALRLEDFTAMCPALNVQQLYRLATTFWDDSPPPPQPPAPPAAALAVAEGPEGAKGTEASAEAVEEVVLAAGATAAEGDSAAAEAEEVAEEVGPEKEVGSAGVAAEEGKAGEGAEAAEANTAGRPEAAVEGAAEGETATANMGAAPVAIVAAEAAAAAAAEAADARAGAGAAPAAPSSPSAPAAATEMAAAASPVVVSRNVSGEVLEEMKRRHAVANNGGLIVTFLLDDDSAPLIAPGGVVARQLLQLINEPRLHADLTEGLPPLLLGEDCPPQVFAFLTHGGSGSGSAAAVADAAAAVAAAAGAEHAAST